MALLVAMVYALPGLDWNNEKDHTELFAGVMSVTAGEIQDIFVDIHVCLIIFVFHNTQKLSSGVCSLQCSGSTTSCTVLGKYVGVWVHCFSLHLSSFLPSSSLHLS